jgi:SAM-dependent methyltransferase
MALLYGELAGWFHLLSPPDEYTEEARIFRDLLTEVVPERPARLLELGSGAGCNAFHLKREFVCTLSDVSPGMLEASRSINPECEHVEGDMRTLRLGRTFDAIFVHDAVCYMTTEADLQKAIETAFVHCRPGGAALFAPDYVKETFRPNTTTGGTDGGDRALRFLEWDWDSNPDDSIYVADFVYVLRERGKDVRVVHDRHVEGLFPRATWERLLAESGFQARRASCPGVAEGEIGELFVAVRPA